MLVLEAGRRDYSWDVFIHMPAALAFPIGSRFYDWKYESEPEPFMNGRRIYHARGKVLGGSSSINGMIFQRGNPLDYERWAADPGMETWDYAHCLPYFKKMETLPRPAADEFRGDDGPARARTRPGREPAVRRVLRSGAAGRLPAHRRRQRLPAGGLRQVRSQHPPRPAARAPRVRTSTRCSTGRTSSSSAARSCTKMLFDGTRATGVEYAVGRGRDRSAVQARRGDPVRRRDQLAAAAAVSAVSATPIELRALGIPVVHDLPGVGEHLQDHLEVYIQHACTQPVSMQPALKMWRRPSDRLAVAVPPGSRAPRTTSRRVGSCAATTTSTYPNLMFHFLPIAIRYDGSAAGRR